jgi:predicted nucleic acid-binding protein
MILVVNASPLIVLSKAGLMDLILGLATELIIPEPVAHEVSQAKDPADPAKSWLMKEGGLVKLSAPATPFLAAWDLGTGETSVISLVQTLPGSIAVLDDLAARRCAQALGIPVIGTLAIILAAKQRGALTAVKPALDAVVAAGLFISPAHIHAVLVKAGEAR